MPPHYKEVHAVRRIVIKIIIIAVISIAPYLPDKGEHRALYNQENVHIKTST